MGLVGITGVTDVRGTGVGVTDVGVADVGVTGVRGTGVGVTDVGVTDVGVTRVGVAATIIAATIIAAAIIAATIIAATVIAAARHIGHDQTHALLSLKTLGVGLLFTAAAGQEVCKAPLAVLGQGRICHVLKVWKGMVVVVGKKNA